MPKFTDLMIDFETLDTVASAVILSIGAVRFNIDTGEIDDRGFYASITVESNLAMGRTISDSTLKWWMQQSPAAQAVFTEPKTTLELALGEFYEWFGPEDKDMRVWSNGADFDIPMLAHAARGFDWELPWKFWNHKCFRTLKGLPAAKRAKSIPPPKTAHNALDDALAQATHACAIWKELK